MQGRKLFAAVLRGAVPTEILLQGTSAAFEYCREKCFVFSWKENAGNIL